MNVVFKSLVKYHSNAYCILAKVNWNGKRVTKAASELEKTLWHKALIAPDEVVEDELIIDRFVDEGKSRMRYF